MQIDWQLELQKPIVVAVQPIELPQPPPPPQVISLRIGAAALKTKSYVFSPQAAEQTFQSNTTSLARLPGRKPRLLRQKSSRTRISPPKDVVKLSDKLFFLLQPPLETLIASNVLEFPFEPFDFQIAGVAFLYPRKHAVLADEMGLGKTMQAITALRMLVRSGNLKRVLLICPKPLVTNWKREFELWAAEIPVSVIGGAPAKRNWQWNQDTTPVKIANYEVLVRDAELVIDLPEPFDLVVVDEAQRIKNQSSATGKIIRSINRNRSWALTGTPIENSINDLFGIFSFVAPGSISPHMSHRDLKSELRDYVLRRTKEMVVQDMPAKLIRDMELDLTFEQANNYQQAEQEGVIRLTEMGDQIKVKHVFELVLRLKQICNFDPATGASSKLELLNAELEEIAASGHKSIIFSQWVQTLEQIGDRIACFNPLYYHGRIQSTKRDAILTEFKESAYRPVLLMSYGAGAVGLNLQFCRYVYLFDRWWNPAVEDQAINRAHRIGGAGSVTVTRMIMSGTIEQRIHEILESKRELFQEILGQPTTPTHRGLTREEIFGLFNLKTPQGPFVPGVKVA
jgi:SNF2 family DNA or RNA helicase